MRPRRGTAIKPDASADLLLPRSPSTRPRQGAPAPDAGRFSPLNAPQRALVEGFLAEARPWGMKQARRSFRHLPAELHEQAYEQAAVALRATADPGDLDRRRLYGALAEKLDDELRRIHVGWCLNQARVEAPGRTAPAAPVDAPVAAPLTAFLEEGLGGLERAVLQLEIGAGRDTHTVRAALRLGPRQYGRHREVGLAKLRGAIAGGLRGQVCEQHLDTVTLAATGDRAAADSLTSGADRCRACAREATGLQRVLQQRLAISPWPFAIAPAGALSGKLAALGAIFSGKAAAGGGAGLAASTSGATKVVAALVATAAVATGGIAAVERDPVEKAPAAAATPVKRTVSAATPAQRAPVKPASTAAAPATGSQRAVKRRKARTRRSSERAPASTPSIAAATPTAAPQPSATAAPQAPAAGKPLEPVRKTVDQVKKTVDGVKEKLPVQTPLVDQVTDGLDKTVDDVTGAVDALLAP